jgi:hypothetical protein
MFTAGCQLLFSTFFSGGPESLRSLKGNEALREKKGRQLPRAEKFKGRGLGSRLSTFNFGLSTLPEER